jgi:hypothetical protein
VDGIEQFIFTEWFGQIGNGPIGASFEPCTVVGCMRRDENNRHVMIAGQEPAVEFDATHPWQAHI